MRRHHRSWITLAREQANEFPGAIAYRFLENGERVSDIVTYQEMDIRARALAACLQDFCRPGDRVLLVYDSCVENIVAFFGCLYAGLLAVPVCPPHRNRRNTRFENIILDCSPRLALSTSRKIVELKGYLTDQELLHGLPWLGSDAVAMQEADSWHEPQANDDTLAFLQYTSGSTAVPKGVAVSHGNLLHNQAMMEHAFKTRSSSTIVSWLPLFHDMGLIGKVLHAFYVGATCVLMSPMSFLQSPLRWLQAISTHRAEMSGGPNFAYGLCTQKIPDDSLLELDLSSWRVALNGAEPVQHDTIQAFTRRFSPCGFREQTFYAGYGMAEATLIISGGSSDKPPTCRWLDKKALRKDRAIAASSGSSFAQPLVGCGTRILDEAIIVVNSSNQPCPDEEIGEIWVAGKHITQGYWGRPEATRDTFHAYLKDGRGPFLRTGDLGFLKEGELFITGRIKDVIILHGAKYYPQDIEASIQAAISAVRPEGVAAVCISGSTGEQVVVIAEIQKELIRKTGLRAITDSIRKVVWDDYGIALQDVMLIRPGSLPKTTSGKMQRRLYVDLYLSEGFQVCYRAATHEVTADVSVS